MSNSSQPKSSILFIADALRPDMLGPYGNTWFDTPCLNQLASDSLLFEYCVIDTPDLELGMRSILRGQHCCDQPDRMDHLIDISGAQGVESVLVSTDPNRISESADIFDRIIEVQRSNVYVPAHEIESTELATFFAAAIEIVQQIDGPTMLVLDCDSFSKAWDAPYEIRVRLSDDDDPDPTTITEPPNLQFNPATDDPDQLLDYQTAYGAQVVLLDQLLGILLEQISETNWSRDALFCLTSPRGYPLGEHGVVGFYRQVLNKESLHVPLLIRWPKTSRIVGRSQQLVQPGSLYSLYEDWHCATQGRISASTFRGLSATRLLSDKKTAAVVSKCQTEAADCFSLQTYAWKFLSGPARQLFVKPDDVWEVNDVAELCPEIAEGLNTRLEEYLIKLKSGALPSLDLSDELAYGIE